MIPQKILIAQVTIELQGSTGTRLQSLYLQRAKWGHELLAPRSTSSGA
jgi:hypothetical protein